MSSVTPNFSAALRAFQRRWRAGLIVAGGMRAIFWTGVLFAGIAVLDFYGGFSDGVRHMVFTVLVTACVAGVFWSLWDAVVFARRNAADEADRLLASGRRETLSALELEAQNAADGTVAAWLRQKAIDQAGERLVTVPPKGSLPIANLRRQGILCGAFVLVAVIAASLWSEPVSIITQRLLRPDADIPPYTRLRFVLSPKPAEVLYGDAILVSAEITNAAISSPVRCLTRDPATGHVDESPAFQESPTRFSVKLEKMAVPVDVAFAVGRARSEWLPVSVKLQPKVQDVMVKVVPPSYTGLPTREFALGSQELAALPGSKVSASLASNRPLKGGALRIQPFGRNAVPEDVAAVVDDPHHVHVEWTVRQAARLSVQIHDIAGVASAPVELEQKVLPDERPQAVMRQPAGDVLATPDTELPLEATASDDYGLTRVSFVRHLQGYRERSQGVAVTRGQRQQTIQGNLKLAPYGLVPGQTIELTLEAGDTNPNLLGTGVSEPARIHIITREQYAEMLRTQTTLEEFSARYEALTNAMDEARKAVQALEDAVKSGDAEKIEQARKDALAAHERAGKVFGQIAKDFPVFDLDKELAKSTLDAMQRLFENAKDLQAMEGQPQSDLKDAVPRLKDRIGAIEKQMADDLAKGQKAVAAGEIFEQTAKFQELIEQQRELVKDYNRTVEQIRRGEMQAAQALKDLTRRQQDIAEGMREMQTAMNKAVENLPEELTNMREEADAFLDALEESKAVPTMKEGVKAGENSDSKTASDRAAEALARLEALLRKNNGICKMCRGEGEKFPWPEDLSETLKQLMDSLIPKPGGKEGNKPGTGGGGPGFGGSSDSGFAMRGKMPRMPVYGPSRSKFAHNGNPQLGSGNGKGNGNGGAVGGADVDSSKISREKASNGAGDAMITEAIPETYREAVKRYFSAGPDESSARPNPSTQP